MLQAACSARVTRERRSLAGGTGGQLLTAKPVTSPDSARATEPRATVATLELRLGARFGSGAGERERERAPAARSKAVAATWLDRSRRGVEDAAGDAVAAAEAAVEAAEPPEPALPITLERPCAMDSSSSASAVSWLQAGADHHRET